MTKKNFRINCKRNNSLVKISIVKSFLKNIPFYSFRYVNNANSGCSIFLTSHSNHYYVEPMYGNILINSKNGVGGAKKIILAPRILCNFPPPPFLYRKLVTNHIACDYALLILYRYIIFIYTLETDFESEGGGIKMANKKRALRSVIFSKKKKKKKRGKWK